MQPLKQTMGAAVQASTRPKYITWWPAMDGSSKGVESPTYVLVQNGSSEEPMAPQGADPPCYFCHAFDLEISEKRFLLISPCCFAMLWT